MSVQHQHIASRKRSLKMIRQILPSAIIKEIGIETKHQSEFIHFIIDIGSINTLPDRVEFKLVNYQSVPTEKYGNLGVVSIELSSRSSECYSLGIPNRAFSVDRDRHLNPLMKWNMYRPDNLLPTIFEDNTITDFVEKVIAKLKQEYKKADDKSKKTKLNYPAKANIHLIEAKKIEYQLCMATALLESLICISNAVNDRKDGRMLDRQNETYLQKLFNTLRSDDAVTHMLTSNDNVE